MIHDAKRVAFLTSAGMSADSNIPTFRDKEGYWSNFPPFKEKGLEAQDLASPWAFRNELPHAWAFYEWRRRNAALPCRSRLSAACDPLSVPGWRPERGYVNSAFP